MCHGFASPAASSASAHADVRACATGFYASETTAPSKEEAKAVLLRARELGIGFYNTAILYGPETNEQLIGATALSRLARAATSPCSMACTAAPRYMPCAGSKLARIVGSRL